jgi:hypothetical protein
MKSIFRRVSAEAFLRDNFNKIMNQDNQSHKTAKKEKEKKQR